MRKSKNTLYDCIIIGAGPAGLLAAAYLARFRRKILVINNGSSRASLISTSHNYPGTIKGISGEEILNNLRQQCLEYDVSILQENITNLQQNPTTKYFTASSKKKSFQAKRLLLATGVTSIEPDLPNLKHAIYKKLVRHCMICDGYEAIDKKVAIIGQKLEPLFNEALFLQTYTKDITLLSLGKPLNFNKNAESICTKLKIKIIQDPIMKVEIVNNEIKALRLKNNRIESFDILYSALGTIPRSELAKQVNAKLDKGKCILTKKDQSTSVKNLYAAGDVTSCLDQMSTAFGQAAIAATSIHRSLMGLLR